MFRCEVSFLQPHDDSPEGVVVKVAESPFGDSVTEIGCTSPAAPGSIGAADLRAFDVWLGVSAVAPFQR